MWDLTIPGNGDHDFYSWAEKMSPEKKICGL
jgi:hypothetical protein